MTKYVVLLAVGLVGLLAGPLAADPRKGEFSVHELSLWIADTAGSMANARAEFTSGFPATVSSSRATRSSLSERRDGPLALLTFHGRPDTELDVELKITAGSFLAHWPAAESAPNRLRWAKNPATALIAAPADDSTLMMVDEGHWFARARQGDALFVDRGARTERFLAYDAELNLPAPIQLQGGDDVYQVANVSNGTLYDVLIARLTPEGIRVAWLDELPPSKSKIAGPAKAPLKAGSAAAGLFGSGAKKAPADAPAAPAANEAAAAPTGQKPAAAPAADKPKQPAGLFGVQVKKADAAPAKEVAAPADKNDQAARPPADPKKKPGLFGVAGQAPAAAAPAPNAAAPQPAAQPAAGQAPVSPQPAASLAGVEVRLSAPVAADSEDAAAQTTKALAERLAKQGLSPVEIDVFLSRYSAMLFQSSELVVMCRMQGGVLDEKVPLSVFPVPAAIVRVPLVVVRNADPGLRNQIVELVSRLGAADYAARQDAEKRLVELGPLAFEALKKAIQDNDMEIVIRAERVLLKQNQPAAGRQGTPDAKQASARAPGALALPVAAPAPVAK